MNDSIMTVNAETFRSSLEGLRMAINSLKGCRDYERANEIKILKRNMSEVLSSKLARKNDRLEALKESLLNQAYKAYSDHILAIEAEINP